MAFMKRQDYSFCLPTNVRCIRKGLKIMLTHGDSNSLKNSFTLSGVWLLNVSGDQEYGVTVEASSVFGFSFTLNERVGSVTLPVDGNPIVGKKQLQQNTRQN